MPAKTTFKHQTETGDVETRRSATMAYTHVVVIDEEVMRRTEEGGVYYNADGEREYVLTGRRVVSSWSQSEENAAKAARSKYLADWHPAVEAINGGERDAPKADGPYLLAVVSYPAGSPMPSGTTKRAFLTLDDAQTGVVGVIVDLGHGFTPATARDVERLVTVVGGTVDVPGATILVKPKTWTELVDAVDQGEGIPARGSAEAKWPTPEQKLAIVAAYNARQDRGSAVHEALAEAVEEQEGGER